MILKCVVIAFALFVPALASAKEEPQTLEQRCTSDEALSYRGKRHKLTYVFDVENKCERTLRCELHISVLNAYGLARGDKVLILAPKSRDSLVLKVKGWGGMNMHTHHCKEI
jgi:hypothetical protein